LQIRIFIQGQIFKYQSLSYNIHKTTLQLFNFSMSTAYSSLRELVSSVLKNLPNIKKMPESAKKLRESTQPFYKYNFPNVVGAIERTMIEVHPPQKEKIDLFLRKLNTSVSLTAVRNDNKVFFFI